MLTVDYLWYWQNDAVILGQAETVVVLDEEDAQPIEPVLEVDEGEGW